MPTQTKPEGMRPEVWQAYQRYIEKHEGLYRCLAAVEARGLAEKTILSDNNTP